MISEFFPNSIKSIIEKEEIDKYLEEIRIRANQNIILKLSNKEKIINYKTTSKDILEIMQTICENSIYSYQKEICEGYITVKGGHRVGITRRLCNRESERS